MQAYQEKFIKDLTKQDTKVAVSGFIVDKNNNSIIVDDNTGSIPVIIETNLNLNNFVRVFGTLIYSNEPQLQAHLIQDLTNVNKQLYQKVKLLLNQK
ncbi:MAG: hypothetical protein AABX55_02755 [Nanoarchaeota archaeon]